MTLRDLSNFSIYADGVTIIMEERRQQISIHNCTNLHFEGVTLDHDPLPWTQATITAHALDWSWGIPAMGHDANRTMRS